MKKKRLALGLLLSVVLVAALNGAYLKRLPINVMLEVSGKGCGVQLPIFPKKPKVIIPPVTNKRVKSV